jgi:uncharacterized protein YggE
VRVLAIRDAQGEAMPMMMEPAAMDVEQAAQAVAPPPVQTGVNTSEVSIRVDFALAPR